MSTFISYSRVNSAFVVRLAKDLKSAGFDVWLDQLDIPKGARWDDEIEAAVERATTFMVVLAPESMESQNVKDELSYAIDSGKFILPVIIKPCKIPLRLRRFQYVDFSDKPYKDSLADIKHLLTNMRPTPKPEPAPVEMPPVVEPEDPYVSFEDAMVQREMVSHPEPLRTESFEEENPRRKAIAIAVLIAAIGMAGIIVFAVSAARSNRDVPTSLPVIISSSTLTPEPPTETPTITPTPLPKLVTDFRGVAMMLVSAGEFTMGSNSGPKEESPAEQLFLSDFYIDKYEVTNMSYKVCVDAGQCQPPKKDASRTHKGYFSNSEYKKYPVVYVSWDMANDYCSWRGARLPTEAEFEKAARGPNEITYPWGNDISCDQANFSGCGKDTESVNSFDAGQSIYEVYDLAGNVSEWTSSLYGDYPYESAREDLMASGERVVRGGSFSDSDQQARTTARQKVDPSSAKDDIGFRCVGMPSGSTEKFTLVTVTPTRSPTQTKSKGDSSDGGTAIPTSMTPTSTDTPTPLGAPTATATDTPTPTSDGPTVTDTPTDTPTVVVPPVPPTDTPTDVVPTDTPTDVPVPPTDTPTDPPPPPTDTPTDVPPPAAADTPAS